MIRALQLRLARIAMAAARRLTPPGEQEWVKAMEAELVALDDPAAKLRWSSGCLVAALNFSCRSPDVRFHALCCALLVLITVHDWRSADPTLTYLALVFVPGLLAYGVPERRWRIGLLFGLWLLGAHAFADLSATLRPHYQRLPLSAAELTEIALLLAITVPAALLGARARSAGDQLS